MGKLPGWLLLSCAVAALVRLCSWRCITLKLRCGSEAFRRIVLALAVTVIEATLIVAVMLRGAPHGSAGPRPIRGGDHLWRRGTLFGDRERAPPRAVVPARRHHRRCDADHAHHADAGTGIHDHRTRPDTVSGAARIHRRGLTGALRDIRIRADGRHRQYFLPENFDTEDGHATPPTTPVALASLALLLLSLVAVVGLAKVLSPSVEAAVLAAALPHAVVGVAIAMMVLLPETVAAVRAANRNRMQISFNLALGSAIATIGLTIPTVAVTSIALGLPLELGLPPKEVALLALSLLLSSMTLAGGRATVLQGAVHLVLFAVFVFLAMVP